MVSIPNTREWAQMLKRTSSKYVYREVSGTTYLLAKDHLGDKDLRWLARKVPPGADAYFYRLPPKSVHRVTLQLVGHPQPGRTLRLNDDAAQGQVLHVILPLDKRSRSLTGLAVLRIRTM